MWKLITFLKVLLFFLTLQIKIWGDLLSMYEVPVLSGKGFLFLGCPSNCH